MKGPREHQTTLTSLDGMRGIVTGGGSGIGRALALAIARAGGRVLVCGRRKKCLQETVALAPLDAPPIEILPCDLTRRESAAEIAARYRSLSPRLDFLVNNAGISHTNPIDDDDKDEGWDRILATNLTAPYRLIKGLLSLMSAGGRIVNISSVLGKFGVAGYSAYCSSKHGIIGLTRALALELAPRGITVNAICPGWVETGMAASGMRDQAQRSGITLDEFKKAALERVPIGRMLSPEEMTPLVLYLLSKGSAGMTGQAMNLSGGATTA